MVSDVFPPSSPPPSDLFKEGMGGISGAFPEATLCDPSTYALEEVIISLQSALPSASGGA